jgi:hypothetical protein
VQRKSRAKDVSPPLEEPGCNGDADTEQHDATENLAPFADPGAQQTAKFQPGQSHGDADGTDDNRRGEQGHVIGAESEADGEVVDAERKPGDEELARALSGRTAVSSPWRRNALISA